MKDVDHLTEWSRLQNEITVHAMAREAYITILSRGPEVESFATWLMAGTGATAGLLIVNIGAVTDTVGRGGVQWMLYSLIASLAFGLTAKAIAVFAPSNVANLKDGRDRLDVVLEKHQAKRKQIEEMAESSGRPVPASFTIQEALNELIRPFPWTVKLIFHFVMRKQIIEKEQNGDLHLGLRGWRLQVQMCVLQLLAVLTTLVSVAIHVLN